MSDSVITSVDIRDRASEIGLFRGDAFERVYGSIRGVVGETEDVVALAGPRGTEPNSKSFARLIRRHAATVIVDAENRGGPSMLNLIASKVMPSGAPSGATYPYELSERCLFDGTLAYARRAMADRCLSRFTADAQGVGLVVERDFGRLLSLEFDNRILAGMSQSSWFVNTFVAEGFNVDPATGGGVFTSALAHLSAGNWLAINKLGDDGKPQQPYVRPNGAPLRADQILTRPDSDPFMVDIASYTDYYRIRASVFASGPTPAGALRYDFPAPHAPATPELAAVFVTLGCNGGELVPLNPISSTPYVRALLVGLARRRGMYRHRASLNWGRGPSRHGISTRSPGWR